MIEPIGPQARPSGTAAPRLSTPAEVPGAAPESAPAGVLPADIVLKGHANTMTATTATKTRTRKPAAAKAPVYKSKSAEALALLKGEDPAFPTLQSISAVEDIMSARGRRMGYAFIYGVAKRNGLATTAAKRRAVRAITKDAEGVVTVQTATGPIAVSPDGTVAGTGWTVSPAGLFAKARVRKAR